MFFYNIENNIPILPTSDYTCDLVWNALIAKYDFKVYYKDEVIGVGSKATIGSIKERVSKMVTYHLNKITPEDKHFGITDEDIMGVQ